MTAMVILTVCLLAVVCYLVFVANSFSVRLLEAERRINSLFRYQSDISAITTRIEAKQNTSFCKALLDKVVDFLKKQRGRL